MSADPLTIAYIAIGVAKGLAGASDAQRAQARRVTDGHLDVVQAALEYASAVDKVETADVHCYDIARPFGQWFAGMVCSGALPTTTDVRLWCERYHDPVHGKPEGEA